MKSVLRSGIILACGLILAGGLSAFAANASISAATGSFHWRSFLAPFHAVALHFPIGFLTMAVILEIYSLRRPSLEIRRVAVLVLWLSLLTGVISATFGILRGATGGYEAHTLSVHRIFGMSVPVFTLITLLFQKMACRREALRVWDYAYRSLLVVTLTLVVIAGHGGAALRMDPGTHAR